MIEIRPAFGFVIRGKDQWGEGRYHATRDKGLRMHEGVDLAVWPGSPVLAPLNGVIERVARPYTDDPRFGGVLIRSAADPSVTVKMFYLELEAGLVGRHVMAGDRIGHAQDLREKYLEITPHIHLEVWQGGRRIDPMPHLVGAPLA